MATSNRDMNSAEVKQLPNSAHSKRAEYVNACSGDTVLGQLTAKDEWTDGMREHVLNLLANIKDMVAESESDLLAEILASIHEDLRKDLDAAWGSSVQVASLIKEFEQKNPREDTETHINNLFKTEFPTYRKLAIKFLLALIEKESLNLHYDDLKSKAQVLCTETLVRLKKDENLSNDEIKQLKITWKTIAKLNELNPAVEAESAFVVHDVWGVLSIKVSDEFKSACINRENSLEDITLIVDVLHGRQKASALIARLDRYGKDTESWKILAGIFCVAVGLGLTYWGVNILDSMQSSLGVDSNLYLSTEAWEGGGLFFGGMIIAILGVELCASGAADYDRAPMNDFFQAAKAREEDEAQLPSALKTFGRKICFFTKPLLTVIEIQQQMAKQNRAYRS